MKTTGILVGKRQYWRWKKCDTCNVYACPECHADLRKHASFCKYLPKQETTVIGALRLHEPECPEETFDDFWLTLSKQKYKPPRPIRPIAVKDLTPSKMTVAEVKAELKVRGLKITGNKADLAARLCVYEKGETQESATDLIPDDVFAFNPNSTPIRRLTYSPVTPSSRKSSDGAASALAHQVLHSTLADIHRQCPVTWEPIAQLTTPEGHRHTPPSPCSPLL